MHKTKIIIIDDHPIVRQGLRQLINQENDFIVCGEAENALDAIDLIEKTKPDCAIVDISLKDKSGIELIKDMNLYYPDIRVLVLSMHDESIYAERALRASARGYIMKQEGTEKLIQAIRKILAGGIYISHNMNQMMLYKLISGCTAYGSSIVEILSDRELEVYKLIGQGTPTRKISEILHLSIKTIETYRENIKKKLHITNATELISRATQWVQQEKVS